MTTEEENLVYEATRQIEFAKDLTYKTGYESDIREYLDKALELLNSII